MDSYILSFYEFMEGEEEMERGFNFFILRQNASLLLLRCHYKF